MQCNCARFAILTLFHGVVHAFPREILRLALSLGRGMKFGLYWEVGKYGVLGQGAE